MLQNETFRRNFKHSVDFRRDDGDDEDNQTRFLRISINGTKNLSHRSCPSINRKSNISDFSHICFEPKAAQQASVSFIFRFYALRALEPSAPFVRFGPSNVAPLREMRDDGPCRVDDVVKRALALQTFVSDFCYAGQLGLHVGQRVFQGSPLTYGPKFTYGRQRPKYCLTMAFDT